MSANIKRFLTELEKYKKYGTEEVEWYDWAYYEIDEDIVSKFTLEDWVHLKKVYKNKSENIKSLIAAHINLDELQFAEVQLEILTDLMLTEHVFVGLYALQRIIGYFISSKRGVNLNKIYFKDLKGFFLLEKSEPLIEKFFNQDFMDKVKEIAKESEEYEKKEINKFLRIISS